LPDLAQFTARKLFQYPEGLKRAFDLNLHVKINMDVTRQKPDANLREPARLLLGAGNQRGPAVRLPDVREIGDCFSPSLLRLPGLRPWPPVPATNRPDLLSLSKTTAASLMVLTVSNRVAAASARFLVSAGFRKFPLNSTPARAPRAITPSFRKHAETGNLNLRLETVCEKKGSGVQF
jgi:hypothetical protein